LLRADAQFWKSPDTPDAHRTIMRQAFDGVAMVLLVAGILTEPLLRNQIPELVWDSAIAGGSWRCASETPARIFPYRMGHYWAWRDEETDGHGLFQDEMAVRMVRLPGVSAQVGERPDLGMRLEAAARLVLMTHEEQATRMGIGRSTYYEVKAGRGGKKARRRAEAYLRSLDLMPKPD
jgi:hypothetical protein